ncbi:hypothetical protein [Ascidiimonas aurantiaca]|uniref:hypothetical protein n=1 Tax=Ascidiimonas aurantiaca TaxID=1685432 RepID=UPI0030EB3A0D
MNKTFIILKKQRELGEILTDTFAFLRNEFKPFFKLILQIAGPYLLIAAAGGVLYFYGFFSSIDTESGIDFGMISVFAMLLGFLLLFFGGVASYVLSYSVTLNYIKSYDQNKGEVHIPDVRKWVKESFWSILGLGILNGIMLLVGFILCLIPGIYLWVPLTMTFAILIYRNHSVTDAISESFTLIKDEWWNTFLYLLVIGIIVGVAGYVFSIPAAVYSWIKMGVFMNEMNLADPTSFIDPVYVVLNLLSYTFRFFLNLISVVASILIYFHLNEKKNFTGTYQRISSLGDRSEK